MYRKIIAFLVVAFFIVGCSSRKYYEPQKVAGNIKYTQSLKTSLMDVSRDGATYKNGQVIAKKGGLLPIVIPKGFRYVNESEGKVIITSGLGEVKVLDSASNVIFSKTFDRELVGASIKGNLLAMVFGDNLIMLYDIDRDHMIYKEALVRAVALDARLANPLFLNDLVVFPTLDGRLLIMDSRKKIVLRDVAISNKALFNNVLFLDVIDNVLIAATASKVISIDPKKINNLNVDVKDVIYKNSKVYIFTKSGKVILCDENLEKLKEIKFPYALFSAVFENGKLYAVEKQGYLIEIEPDLSSYRVLKMPDEIEKSLFATGDKIYFDSHILDIN